MSAGSVMAGQLTRGYCATHACTTCGQLLPMHCRLPLHAAAHWSTRASTCVWSGDICAAQLQPHARSLTPLQRDWQLAAWLHDAVPLGARPQLTVNTHAAKSLHALPDVPMWLA